MVELLFFLAGGLLVFPFLEFVLEFVFAAGFLGVGSETGEGVALDAAVFCALVLVLLLG